jgi:flagellar hook assembly protein FlgD
VLDAGGRLVRNLFNGTRDAGRHSETWDGLCDSGTPAASGAYFVRLRFADRTSTMKLLLTR